MISNCPNCKQAPEHKDMVICKTKGCIEYDLQYNVWEWNNIPDLKELAELQEDLISGC